MSQNSTLSIDKPFSGCVVYYAIFSEKQVCIIKKQNATDRSLSLEAASCNGKQRGPADMKQFRKKLR